MSFPFNIFENFICAYKECWTDSLTILFQSLHRSIPCPKLLPISYPFNKMTHQSHLCCPCRGMVNLSETTHPKNAKSSSHNSHQLFETPQLQMRVHELLLLPCRKAYSLDLGLVISIFMSLSQCASLSLKGKGVTQYNSALINSQTNLLAFCCYIENNHKFAAFIFYRVSYSMQKVLV